MDSLANHLEGRLLFAIPKKGRLNPSVLKLVSGADIQFRQEHRQDIALVKNHHIALVFLPASDIPYAVDVGNVDIGITGRDQVLEYEAGKANDLGKELDEHERVEEVFGLGFGGCKLQVQVPETSAKARSAHDLVGGRIATSFKELTKQYFRRLERQQSDGHQSDWRNTMRTRVDHLSGSVETACTISGVDGIVDLVESGETMRAAGLKAIDTVCTSTAVLIKSKHPRNKQLMDMVARRIEGVIAAQAYFLTLYNVPRRLLPRAKLITPGKRAPSVSVLDNSINSLNGGLNRSELLPDSEPRSIIEPPSKTTNGGNDDSSGTTKVLESKEERPSLSTSSSENEEWVAVSSMVKRSDAADKMDELAALGAKDILCLDISNSRSGG